MHDQLIQREADYVMLLDAVESYKRRIRMLEASLEPTMDPKLF